MIDLGPQKQILIFFSFPFCSWDMLMFLFLSTFPNSNFQIPQKSFRIVFLL